MKNTQPLKQERVARERLQRATAKYDEARERASEARRAALAVAHRRPVPRCSVHRTGWFDCPVCGQMCFGNPQLQCSCGRKADLRDRLEATKFLRSCEVSPGVYLVEVPSDEADVPLFGTVTRDKYEAVKRGIPSDESWRMWPIPAEAVVK